MEDEVKKLKNLRRTKSATFTRKQNNVQSLLDNSFCPPSKLKSAFQEMKDAFSAIETAHENYASIIEEEDLVAEGDYLETYFVSLNALDIKVMEKTNLLEANTLKIQLSPSLLLLLLLLLLLYSFFFHNN